MKIAIVGSRGIKDLELSKYISLSDEIVSGGAIGVDTCAANYAKEHNLKLTEFLPNYARYGKGAPIKRNYEIVDYSDKVIIFWDGNSKGTLSVINYAKKTGKLYEVILCT